MTARLDNRHALAAVIGLTILWAPSCTSRPKSPTSPTIVNRSEAGENAVNQAVASSWKYVQQVYERGTSAPSPSRAPGGNVVAAAVAELMAAEDVNCAGVTMRYYDAGGTEQTGYHAATTTRLTAKGVCTMSGVSATVDLTLDDVQAASSVVVANGTVQGIYQLLPVTAQVKDLRVPKQPCAYPLSGQIVGRAADVAITVEFNGTPTAHASYSREGSVVTYDVQMTGC